MHIIVLNMNVCMYIGIQYHIFLFILNPMVHHTLCIFLLTPLDLLLQKSPAQHPLYLLYQNSLLDLTTSHCNL